MKGKKGNMGRKLDWAFNELLIKIFLI